MGGWTPQQLATTAIAVIAVVITLIARKDSRRSADFIFVRVVRFEISYGTILDVQLPPKPTTCPKCFEQKTGRQIPAQALADVALDFS